MIGTLDYETGDVFCVQEEHYTAIEFLNFLEKVMMHYPNERIVMVLNNARIHHAKLIRPFLEFTLLQTFFIPTFRCTVVHFINFFVDCK